MKDETQVGIEAMKTPVLGVPWAGDTEFGEPTLSDAETILLPRATVLPGAAEEVSEGRSTLSIPSSPAQDHLARSLWKMARSSLLGAAVCGVLGGLIVAVAVVLVVRLTSAHPTAGETKSQGALLSALVRVESPAGQPVEGAVVRVGERTLSSDAEGLVRFEQPLGDATGMARYRFELTCPGGMQAPQPTRELMVPRSAAGAGKRVERTLSLTCVSTRVALTLALRAEGGEARFWLGEEDLGVTTGGQLEATVAVDKRTEQNLRAEPVTPKDEKRKPTLSPPARTVVVLDDDLRLEYAVKISWPRVKAKAAPAQQIPYRL